MLRIILTSFVFVFIFTAAKADNYAGVSAILSATMEHQGPGDDSGTVDNEFNSGFVLTFGNHLSDNIAIEFSYIRYIDLYLGDNSSQFEITSLEPSVILSADRSGPFVRIGYSDLNLTETLGVTHDSNISGDNDITGSVFGFGYGLDMGENTGKLRFEYNVTDYDDLEVEIWRFSIGAIIDF